MQQFVAGGPATGENRTAGDGIFDGDGEFERIYAPAPGELILIRPDGYLAARLDGTDSGNAESALSRLIPSAGRVNSESDIADLLD